MTKKILLALVLISSANVMAQGRRVEPGPVVKLEESAGQAIDALLLASPTDLKEFIARGNVTTEVTQQNWQPGVTNYTFTRQQCMRGGITGGMCLGGVQLRVTTREIRQGSMVTTEATSSTALLR